MMIVGLVAGDGIVGAGGGRGKRESGSDLLCGLDLLLERR